MIRFALRLVLAGSLIGTGWVAARAQTPTPPTPDFEISVVAPAGWTTVTCVRGCQFAISQMKNGVTSHGRIPSFSSELWRQHWTNVRASNWRLGVCKLIGEDVSDRRAGPRQAGARPP